MNEGTVYVHFTGDTGDVLFWNLIEAVCSEITIRPHARTGILPDAFTLDPVLSRARRETPTILSVHYRARENEAGVLKFVNNRVANLVDCRFRAMELANDDSVHWTVLATDAPATAAPN